MDTTITMLGGIGLGIAVIIAIAISLPRRRSPRSPQSLRPTTYRPSRSGWPGRPGRRTSPEWASSEAVFFVGSDNGSDSATADSGAGAEAGSSN
jgi:hypothetical protein